MILGILDQALLGLLHLFFCRATSIYSFGLIGSYSSYLIANEVYLTIQSSFFSFQAIFYLRNNYECYLYLDLEDLLLRKLMSSENSYSLVLIYNIKLQIWVFVLNCLFLFDNFIFIEADYPVLYSNLSVWGLYLAFELRQYGIYLNS